MSGRNRGRGNRIFWLHTYRHFAGALGTLAFIAVLTSWVGGSVRLNGPAIGLALAASAVYGLARATRRRENEPRNDGVVPRQVCPVCGEDWRQLPIAGACPGCQMPYDETTMIWGERDFEGRYLRFVLVGPADVRIRTRREVAVIPLEQIRNISVDAAPAVELKTGEQISVGEALPDWQQARYVRAEALARLDARRSHEE